MSSSWYENLIQYVLFTLAGASIAFCYAPYVYHAIVTDYLNSVIFALA